MMALSGEFSPDLGWNRTNTSKLIWDCFLYAQHLDKEDFRVFTCTVDMQAYRDLKSSGSRLPHPYAICSRFCPEMILKWYLKDFTRHFVQGNLNYFFDRGERHLGAFDLRRKAAAKAVRKPGIDLRTYWDLIGDAVPVDMRKHSPVQLADLISWSHTRRLMRGKYGDDSPDEWKKWSELSKIAETVLPFTRAEFDRDRLSTLAIYGGIIPENVEQEFGPDWLRSI
jgi:hypothetical protein